jgi:hypothetical protein
MATKENLMGLGLPMHLANRLGRTPILVTVAGATIGDARVVGSEEYDLFVFASNGGTGLVLKSPASAGTATQPFPGPLLGDQFMVANLLGAAVALYIRNALVLYSAVSVSGSGGVSMQPGQCFIFRPISASTWTVVGTSVTAA